MQPHGLATYLHTGLRNTATAPAQRTHTGGHTPTHRVRSTTCMGLTVLLPACVCTVLACAAVHTLRHPGVSSRPDTAAPCWEVRSPPGMFLKGLKTCLGVPLTLGSTRPNTYQTPECFPMFSTPSGIPDTPLLPTSHPENLHARNPASQWGPFLPFHPTLTSSLSLPQHPAFSTKPAGGQGNHLPCHMLTGLALRPEAQPSPALLEVCAMHRPPPCDAAAAGGPPTAHSNAYTHTHTCCKRG